MSTGIQPPWPRSILSCRQGSVVSVADVVWLGASAAMFGHSGEKRGRWEDGERPLA